MTRSSTWLNKITRDQYIFIGILFVAIAIRLWDFGIVPYGMNQDGAMEAIDAKALADHGTDRLGMYMPVHLQAWGYGQMSALLSYLSVPFIKLFGLNPVTARLPMLILSIIGAIIIYLLAKEICGVRGAQIALLIVALSPWHFVQSRWALDCNVYPHIMLVGVYFLVRGILYKKKYLYISMIFFALCMYSYGVAFYTLPVFLILSVIYLLIRKWIRIRDSLICVGVYFGLSWPIYLTMMINAFKWNTIETPFFTMPFFPDSIRSSDILFMADNPGKQILENIKSFIKVFWFGDNFDWNTVDGFGALYIWLIFIAVLAIVLVLIGIIKNIRIKDYSSKEISKESADKQAVIMWIMIFWLVCSGVGGLIINVNVNRINILMYAQILFAAFGVTYLCKKKKTLTIVFVVAICINGLLLVRTYFSNVYQDKLDWVFMGGYGECLQELAEKGCEEYYIDISANESKSMECLELQALFYQQIDSIDYQSGKFAEKYHFINQEDMPKEPPKGCAIVFREDASDIYNSKGCEKIVHGRYIAYYLK